MICAKNYDTVFKFVKAMPKILWPLFFPDTVYMGTFQDAGKSSTASPPVTDAHALFGCDEIGAFNVYPLMNMVSVSASTCKSIFPAICPVWL